MPENQTTAHETELRITSNGKSLDVDYTLEDLPLDFNMKGNTKINIFHNLVGRGVTSLNNLYNMQTHSKNRFIFKNSNNIARPSTHYMTIGGINTKRVFKPNTTYTVSYRVRKFQGNCYLKFNAAGVDYKIPKEVGVHSYTFKTSDANFFNWNVNLFVFQFDAKTPDAPIDEWDIEILNCVEGEIPHRYHMEGMASVGDNGGIQISTQVQRPILGEYTLQGDIPQQIDFIETKIEQQSSKYKITWI